MSGSSVLLLSDLDLSVDEASLKQDFESLHCHVTVIEIVRDKQKGFASAYLRFADHDAAVHAVAKLNGRPILSGKNKSKHYQLTSLSADVESSTTKTLSPTRFQLLISNLAPTASQSELFDAFSAKFPGFVGVRVCVDENGSSKGYAFAYFSSGAELEKASEDIRLMPLSGSDKPVQVTKIAPSSVEKQLITVPNSHESRQYCSHIAPTFMQYNEDDLPNQLDERDQEVLCYLKTSSISSLQAGWAHCFDPRMNDTEVSKVAEFSVDKVNNAFFNEAEELFGAVESSRWYPVDHILANVNPVAKANSSS